MQECVSAGTAQGPTAGSRAWAGAGEVGCSGELLALFWKVLCPCSLSDMETKHGCLDLTVGLLGAKSYKVGSKSLKREMSGKVMAKRHSPI